MLKRSKKSHKENNYLEYITKDTNNEIHNKINEIRKQLVNVSLYLEKEKLERIRKRLYEIKKKTQITRTERTRLLNELTEISTDLKFERKKMISDYRDDNYPNLQDIEYMLGDLDDYQKPILVQGLLNDSYQRYNCRGDPTREMPIDSYMNKVILFIRILINEKKTTEQKVQLDIGINLVHIIDNKRIRFYTKSENIKCLPSSNTEDVLNELLASLYEKFKEDLQLCRTSSSFVYESVEDLNIHFHEVDLQRGASYIPTTDWIKTEKATKNPKNINDVYCFMYAATIALYHKELGTNPERISKRLMEHVSELNWSHVDFPVSYKDYAIFEKLNEDIALNVLYVPFNKKTICSEYISSRNYSAKRQITLLKITDNKEKMAFLSITKHTYRRWIFETNKKFFKTNGRNII